jgi:hypothetical protein
MDNTLITAVLVALIGGGVAVYQTISNNRLAAKNKALDIELEKQKLETSQNIIKYDIVTNLLKFSQYQKIYDAVIRLMEHSKVDRFLIFIAINGKTDLNKVTCIFQKYRNDKAELDAVAVYKGLEVDKHYVQLLKKMELEQHITFETNALDVSLIKDIYESENVKWSMWKFIGRVNIDEKNDVIAYCSSSTFNKEGFNKQDLLSIKLHFESAIKPTFMNNVNEMIKNKK